MGKKVVHKNMMHYVLNSLGINKEETFEYDFKAKLEKLHLDNQATGFIYRNVIVQDGKNIPVTVYGKLLDKQIQITFTSDSFKINSTPEELTNLPFLKYSTHFLVVQYENENWQLFDRKIDAKFVTQTSIGDRQTTNNHENRQIYKEFQDVDFKLYPNQEKANNRANNDLVKLANQIGEQLQNPFYQTVKMRVNIVKFNSPSNISIKTNKEFNNFIKQNNLNLDNSDIETYTLTNADSLDDYEVAINIYIDERGNIKIKHELSETYLQEYVNKWQEEANKRGLEVNIEDLRQQVISDFTSAETEKDFYDKFIQSVKATFDKKIAGYIEAVQATQKIGKNIWDEGVINKSVWHSKDEEYQQWPKYMNQTPLIAGAEDGLIDEIVGIPLAFKSVYGIATNKEQREAFFNLFTKEGFDTILESIKQFAGEVKKDEEIRSHFASQTTVMVGTMLAPATKLKKIDDLIEVVKKAAKQSDEFIDGGKTLEKLQRLKKVVRHVETEKALDDLLKKFGSEMFENHLDELLEAAVDVNKKKWLKVLDNFKLGRNLEKNVSNLIKDQLFKKSGKYIEELAQKFGKSVEQLAEMKYIQQLQISLPNGTWTVLDDVFVETIGTGNNKIHKLLVNETKLSKLTDLTGKQNEFLKLLKNGTTEFTTRSISKEISPILEKESKVTIEKYVKTMGSGVEDAVDLTTKILY